MKKITLLLAFLLPLLSFGKVYTSVGNGNWNTSALWSPVGVPGLSDTAIINNSITINNGGYTYINKLTINSGGILANLSTLIIKTMVTNNTGGRWTGAGSVVFSGYSDGTIIKGGGDFSQQGGTWYIDGNSGGGTSTESIDATVSIVKNAGDVVILTQLYGRPIRILNFGSVRINSGTLFSNGGKPTSWTQEANSYLLVVTRPLTNSSDTLVASAPGNNVIFSGGTNYNIKDPINDEFYDLGIANSGVKTLTFAPTLLEDLTFYAHVNFNTSGENFIIGGNWVNNNTSGTVSNFTGTVTFNGSSPQSIQGTTNTRFTNVTVSGSGGLTIAKSCGFTGTLTLSGSGNLSSSGANVDTLISTAASTARIAQVTGAGTITANFVIERYDGRNAANYEILSSPVQGTTLGDWDNDPGFWMSGTGGNDGNAIQGGKTYYSVKKYNEVKNHYDSIPSDSYVLTPGLGVYLWMANSLTSMSPINYNTHGVPSVGNVSYPVTKTAGKGNGFNMIGNPYASSISWTNFVASNASVQTTYYLFEQDGSWHTFTSGSIAMEQGFGIVTSSSTSVTFKESHKSAVNATLERAGNPENENNAVTFTLSDDANSYSCPTIVSFGQDYVTGYSMTEDALFIKSYIEEVPQLYTVTDDQQNLALNRLPDNTNEVDVPLATICNVAANYTLTAGSFNNLSAYNCVCLIDKQTGAVLNNFEDNPSYTFTITQAGQEKDFVLRFTQLAPDQGCNSVASSSSLNNNPDNIQIYSSTEGATINFHLNQQENAVISVYNVMGQKMQEDTKLNAYNNTVDLHLSNTNQLYIIRVLTSDGITVKKLFH